MKPGKQTHLKKLLLLFLMILELSLSKLLGQVPANINSGDPNFPFPQFKSYVGGAQTLADINPEGMPHAELEQRMRDAYTHMCNNLSYQIYDNGVWGPVSVAGVQYVAPNQDNPTGANMGHCYCVEGDGYTLLAAAYFADKATFDGYYMWMHDRQFQETVRFIDGVTNNPGYYGNPGMPGAGSAYGGAINQANVRGGGLAGGSPLDGAEDVALALLMAWKQWGDAGTICTHPFTGEVITYKGEALKMIKTFVTPEAFPWATVGPGVIGLDGYRKSGDVSGEMTPWANGGYTYNAITYVPDNPGPANCGDCGGIYNGYVDYAAPAYWRSFGDALQAEDPIANDFQIHQYRRAEASDDWIMGQAYNQGLIPWSGLQKINEAGAGTTVTFGNMVEGEDFRYGWRTILNYLWNGAPVNNWDPATHQAVAGTNTYEQDMGLRFANFIKNPQGAPYNNPNETLAAMDFCGPATALNHYNQDGTQATRPGGGRYWPLNWIHGTGSPAAVVSQDFDLMAQMFREAVIKFDEAADQEGSGQHYADARPGYFHDWFRTLGMLVLTGNFHDPLDVDASQANMKVYKAVNKTYAFPGDTITYTITYRNYAKADANNVVITDVLPSGLTFLSASDGGTNGGGTVTWNLGTVSGFTSGNLANTMGTVTLQVIVGSGANGRVCNTATIACSNGTGWTSNEYPNNITDVMERNCVDILNDNPLTISKTADKNSVMVGDVLEYTIIVKNKPVDFLNGGRPGVRMTFAYNNVGASSNQADFSYRMYHGAHEPLINYRNYRATYFGKKTGPPTYTVTTLSSSGCTPDPTYTASPLPETAGWNHRLRLTFPSQLAAPTLFLLFSWGDADVIHEGALAAQKIAYHLNTGAAFDWTQDWSYEAGLNVILPATANDPYYPIANDWTDPLAPNQPVTNYVPSHCGTVAKTVTKQLVEEWDGYTWRRVAGTAPVSGRELNNIVVKDTLPSDVTFGGFTAGYTAGTVSGGVITWPTVTTLEVGDSIVYKFWVTVNDATHFGCPAGPTPATITNRASAKADKEPMALASASTNISCTAVAVVSPSMTKTADKAVYTVGDAITYTIKYKNLDGTIVDQSAADGTLNTADWTAFVGSKLNFDATGISFQTGFMSRAMTHRYSHGTNGTIEGRFQIPQHSNTYAIVVRYNGTTWNELRFRINFSDVEVSVWNMPGATQIGATTSLGTYAGHPTGDFDFKIELNGADVNVWMKDAGVASFSVFPQAIITGLTVQAGFAGLRGEGGGADPRYLKKWYTHLDSDFNLQMTDPIPSQVTYVSATNTTYNAVNYAGSDVAGTVTWNTIPGPILADEEITYVWDGTVNACPGLILNTAYAKIQGVSPDPAGQVSVGCNGTTPVRLLDFSGKRNGRNVLLTWSTSEEINNSHFIIERSFNGTDFSPIGQVGGIGNSNSVSYYSFTDYELEEYEVYYRLVQVDIDGTETKSSVISISLTDEEKIVVYPNPFKKETFIEVRSLKNETVSLRVKTVTGEVVYTSEEIFTNEKTSIGTDLADGMYILEIITERKTEIYKLVKSR